MPLPPIVWFLHCQGKRGEMLAAAIHQKLEDEKK